MNLDLNQDIWKKFSPISCRLNVDESDDMDKTWETIASLVGLKESEVRAKIKPVQDL